MSRTIDSIMRQPLRDGDLLIIRDGSLLPGRCPVCAAPAFAETATLQFSKRRHQARDGVVASLIGVAIDKLADHFAGNHYTGPVSVRVRLCHVHAGWRRWLFVVRQLAAEMANRNWLAGYAPATLRRVT